MKMSRKGPVLNLEECLVQMEASKNWFASRVLPLSIEQLRWRPEPQRWSIAECLEHLNITLGLYLSKINVAIRTAHRDGLAYAKCARCQSSESDLLKLVEPPVRVRTVAPPATIPGPSVDPVGLVDEFHNTREGYAAAIRRASGLDLPRIIIVEPLHPFLYSLGGALAFIAAHDRRHMWQAEQVRSTSRFPRAVFAA